MNVSTHHHRDDRFMSTVRPARSAWSLVVAGAAMLALALIFGTVGANPQQPQPDLDFAGMALAGP